MILTTPPTPTLNCPWPNWWIHISKIYIANNWCDIFYFILLLLLGGKSLNLSLYFANFSLFNCNSDETASNLFNNSQVWWCSQTKIGNPGKGERKSRVSLILHSFKSIFLFQEGNEVLKPPVRKSKKRVAKK